MSSLPSSSDVYTGHWINWSKGSVCGSTLTVSGNLGAGIVAFLALYVQISGVSLWSLLAFLTYQWRVPRGQRTGLFQQQQILLRNSESPLSTAVGFLRLGWFWRKTESGVLMRNFFPFTFGLFYALAILIAAIGSSYVVDTNDLEVLARSPNCGFWTTIKRDDATPEMSVQAGIDQNDRWTETLDSSTAYSRACYGDTQGAIAPQCQVYSKPKLTWNTNYNVSCPFDAAECLGEEKPAMELDTGILDLTAFGLNAPMDSRIGLRKVSACAPLYPWKYASVVSAEDMVGRMSLTPLPGEQVIVYDYGENIGGGLINGTDAISTYTMNRTIAYTLTAWRSYVNGGVFSDFSAKPQFARDDADTTIFLLSGNTLIFERAVDDPFFSAHKARHLVSSAGNETVYLTDNPAGVLGCVEQYQFCNMKVAGEAGCTPLQGIMQAYNSTRDLSLDPLQSLTVDLLYDVLFNWYTSLAMVSYSRPPKLLAQRLLESNTQLPLPNNQWQLEVQDWHGTVLAGIQQYLVGHATGPDNPDWIKYFQPRNGTANPTLCHAQKVRISGGYANVNVFGFAFILSVGGLIIIASLVLKHMGIWIQKRRLGAKSGLNVPWIQDELFQVHRAAYQAMGLGHWRGGGDMVPVTAKGEVFRSHWAYDFEEEAGSHKGEDISEKSQTDPGSPTIR